ncbi:MAG: phosphopantetheine-binding protein [Thermodesulfobacteriota bacterium]
MDMFATIIGVLHSKFERKGEFTPETRLKDVGLDSLDTMNFLFSLEESTGVQIPDEAFVEEPIETLGQLASYLASKKG